MTDSVLLLAVFRRMRASGAMMKISWLPSRSSARRDFQFVLPGGSDLIEKTRAKCTPLHPRLKQSSYVNSCLFDVQSKEMMIS